MVTMGKGPQYRDPTDSIRLIRIVLLFGSSCFIMLSALWYFMLDKGWISTLGFVLLLILNLPITAAGVMMIHRTVGAAAVLMVKTMFADGDIPPPPTYPRQDVLIAQGKYDEAADWFRDHLVVEPTDHDARLRLALLLETQLNSYQGSGAALPADSPGAAAGDATTADASCERAHRPLSEDGSAGQADRRAGAVCGSLSRQPAGGGCRARAERVEGG